MKAGSLDERLHKVEGKGILELETWKMSLYIQDAVLLRALKIL